MKRPKVIKLNRVFRIVPITIRSTRFGRDKDYRMKKLNEVFTSEVLLGYVAFQIKP
jgi:hypothetical protein